MSKGLRLQKKIYIFEKNLTKIFFIKELWDSSDEKRIWFQKRITKSSITQDKNYRQWLFFKIRDGTLKVNYIKKKDISKIILFF